MEKLNKNNLNRGARPQSRATGDGCPPGPRDGIGVQTGRTVPQHLIEGTRDFDGPSSQRAPDEGDRVGAGLTVHRAPVACLPETNLRGADPLQRPLMPIGGTAVNRGSVGRSDWTDLEREILIRECSRFQGRVNWTVVKEALENQYSTQRPISALQRQWYKLKRERLAAGQGEQEQQQGPVDGTEETDANEPVVEQSAAGPEVTTEERERTNEEVREESEARSLPDPAMEAFAQDTADGRSFCARFATFFQYAQRGFSRVPVKRISKLDHVKYRRFFELADYLVSRERDRVGPNQSALGRLNAAVYAAARAIADLIKQRKEKGRSEERKWFNDHRVQCEKLSRQITSIELELGRRMERRKPTAAELDNIHRIRAQLRLRSTRLLRRALEQLRDRKLLLEARVSVREQEIIRKGHRLRFEKEPSLRWMQQRNVDEGGQQPSMQSMTQYWKDLIGKRRPCALDDNPMIREWREKMKRQYRVGEVVAVAELREAFDCAIKKMKSWGAAGPDGLQAFWWKAFPSARETLKRYVEKWISTGKVPAGWFCEGRTVLLHKGGAREEPNNYRPITCLNTCYKLCTAVMNLVLKRHVSGGDALPAEQRALRRGQWACTHALLVDQACVLDAGYEKRHQLSMAWLDFKKAFDSIPHEHLLYVLESINVPSTLLTALSRLMKSWSTRLEMKSGRGRTIKSESIRITNGIFQGDSLSPLLFGLSVAPISFALNRYAPLMKSSCGSTVGRGFQIGHQFYMDDLKLYARKAEDLQRQLRVLEELSRAIGLNINVSKCAQVHYNPRNSGGDETMAGDSIPLLGFTSTYKYLGVEERLRVCPDLAKYMREKVIPKVRFIMGTDLSFGQKVRAFNTIAVSGLSYLCTNITGMAGRLSETLARADDLDTELRVLLKECRVRFANSCSDRLYLPAEMGGCGFLSVRDVFENGVLAGWAYAALQPGLEAQFYLFQKMAKRQKRSPHADALKLFGKYGLQVTVNEEAREVTIEGATFTLPTELARHLRRLVQAARNRRRFESWCNHSLAGGIHRREYGIDLNLSSLWLRRGCISALNVRNAMAVQEGSLYTGSRAGRRRCRLCAKEEETSFHIASHCTYWLKTLYIARHNAVARAVYYVLCDKYDLRIIHYSQGVPSVQENDRAQIMWDREIETLHPMFHRRPDIVVFDKAERRILVIEVSVASYMYLRKQRELKINRYTINSTDLPVSTRTPYERGVNLIDDLRERYSQPVDFVPLVVGTCGEHLAQTLELLLSTCGLTRRTALRLLERMSRAAIIGTSRVVRNHLAR